MKITSPDFVDYWQKVCASQRGLANRFGLRVRNGCCWALMQIGDEGPRIFGKPHEIPVDLDTLPPFLFILIDEYRLDYPNDDLVDVLTGKKSLQQALDSPVEIEPKRIMVAR